MRVKARVALLIRLSYTGNALFRGAPREGEEKLADGEDETRNVLTTFKLQALIDARLESDIGNRKALARELSSRGERISVHGVDAWFKRNDSNYAIERPSLHPDHLSFAIPRARWSNILAIFGLQLADIDRDDQSFVDWVFERAVERQEVPDENVWRIAMCYNQDESVSALADKEILIANGYEVVDSFAVTQHSDWSVQRVFNHAQAAVVYLTDRSLSTSLVREIVDFAQVHHLPLISVLCCVDETDVRRQVGDFERFIVNESKKPTPGLEAALQEVMEPQRTSVPERTWETQELFESRPSIAVLPFANFTGNADWDEFADAMAEDITALLSRLPELFVISSSTTRMYKNQLPDSRLVREDLGVRYVLEGSMRIADSNRFRITAQLVDTTNRRGLWSKRFEQHSESPFDAIDELAVAICAQLEPTIRQDNIQEGARLSSAPAWRLWQEGWQLMFVDAPFPSPQRSLDLFNEALEVDPEYPLAHAGYSIALSTGVLWGGLSPARVPEAMEHAEIAYKKLPENAASNYAVAMSLFVQPTPLEPVLEYVSRATELEPSNPMYRGILGFLLAHMGRSAEGVQQARYAMRLSPKDAREPFLCYMLGNALAADEQFQEAISVFSGASLFSEVDFIWLVVAYAHHRLGDTSAAHEALNRIVNPRPLAFYEWAVDYRLWLGHDRSDKDGFKSLLASWYQARIAAKAPNSASRAPTGSNSAS